MYHMAKTLILFLSASSIGEEDKDNPLFTRVSRVSINERRK